MIKFRIEIDNGKKYNNKKKQNSTKVGLATATAKNSSRTKTKFEIFHNKYYYFTKYTYLITSKLINFFLYIVL